MIAFDKNTIFEMKNGHKTEQTVMKELRKEVAKRPHAPDLINDPLPYPEESNLRLENRNIWGVGT